MEPKIIQVFPTEEYFSITWELSRRCNYDCMYCPPEWHNNTSKHKSLDELKQLWLNIYEKSKERNLKYKISFTGGELTSNKNFYPFVKWLRTEYAEDIKQILFTTNGSATYKYYLKLYDVIDNISFSVHSEHVNEEAFFDTVIKLKQTINEHKFIHVNIMDEYWNVDRIPAYQDLLKKHNISHNINKIDYAKQTRAVPIMKGKLNFAISNARVL